MSTPLPPVAYKQDLPPAQGYGTIRYKRNLPFKGPSGAMLFAIVGGLTTFGQWHQKRKKAEKRYVRRQAGEGVGCQAEEGWTS